MDGRIMIFDDDADLLEICGMVLRSRNYLVSVSNRCTDVLSEVSSFSPDVILMDNRIPDAGGVKATQEIKNDSKLKGIPVIFFSGHNLVEELAAEAGAEFFLHKPFEMDELETIVSRAVAIRRQASSTEIK